MPILLVIDASPRGEHSVSRRLTARFVDHWEQAHPTGRVVRRDLMKTRLPFVDECWLGGAFTPAEHRSPEMREAMRASDELIAELMAADHVVIGTPMFNLSIPAVLKAYIDQIVRVGLTVTPEFEGRVQGKKATVILASGSSYATGTERDLRDYASRYLKLILGFLGIHDVAIVLAGRTLAVDRGETTFGEFAAPLEPQLCEAARA